MRAAVGSDATPDAAHARVQWPSLLTAVAVMLAGTDYPPLFTDAGGRPDHALASALCWAMSAGFVRGVGFVPRRAIWRHVFSGPAVCAALALAAALRFL